MISYGQNSKSFWLESKGAVTPQLRHTQIIHKIIHKIGLCCCWKLTKSEPFSVHAT